MTASRVTEAEGWETHGSKASLGNLVELDIQLRGRVVISMAEVLDLISVLGGGRLKRSFTPSVDFRASGDNKTTQEVCHLTVVLILFLSVS